MPPPENKDHSKGYRQKKYRHLEQKEYIALKNEQMKRKNRDMTLVVKIMLIIPILFVFGLGLVVFPLMFMKGSSDDSLKKKEVSDTKSKTKKIKKKAR